jgi:ATP synthase F1 delta subunit
MTPQEISQNIIALLREKHSLDLLPEVVKELQREVYRNHDIHITVATPLTSEEESELTAALTERWGEHQMVTSCDPALLSGMIISFNGTILDTSGLRKLQNLSHALT